MKNLTLTGLVCILAFFLPGCKQTGNTFSDAEVSNYIYGYTSGSISASSPILIYLERPLSKTFSIDEALPEKIIKFSPSVKGTFYLRKGNILEFIPAERLKNGQRYDATLDLGALIDVPKEYKEFKFRFNTIPLSGSLGQGKLTTQDNNEILKYEGTIYTSDYIDDKELESKLKVNYSKGNPSIEWQHSGTLHQFTISNISKRERTTQLTLKLDSKFFEENQREISIPGTSDFSILNIDLDKDNKKVVRIDFSENIDPSQEYESFVSIEDGSVTNYKIENNSFFIYYSGKDNAEYIDVVIHRGLASTTGKKLENTYKQTVSLPSTLPQVNFIGKGNIMPSGGNVLIPFSAVALKAVDIQVIKVFNQNMNFFLQDNSYDGYSSLTRTARPVLQKKVDLQTPERPLDLTRWNDFTINLSELIELERGVVYRVRILFKKSYSILDCPEDDNYNTDYMRTTDWDGEIYYSEYYYPYDYDWSERNNPCHNSYYYGNRFPGKNIVNTPLGIVAKKDINNRYFVAVNDISTAKPVSSTRVVLYDYQNQPLDSATTDKDGFAYIQTEHPAFTVLAHKDKDKAWLKVSENNALSLSNFNVSGENVESGLKGFIYGERGVWRPGDDIYLSFILENKVGKVPTGHPIIAQLTDPQGNITQTKKGTVSDRALYTFKFDTDEDSPTGYWTATIKIGGKSFTKTIRIEAIKPNRLSIDMELPNDNILGEGIGSSRIKVKTKWLHGALAPNKKAETEVKLQKTRYAFKNYTDYSFTNDAISFEPTTYELYDGMTDGEGNFTFDLNNIHIEDAPGVLNATFTTRIYEDGGDFSISSYPTKYSPYSSYVGFRLQDADRGWYPTKKDVRIQGVILDPTGEKISDTHTLYIKVYRQSWRWWWDSDDDEYGQYINRSYNELINEYNVSATAGEFNTTINVEKYGRYFVEVTDGSSGHSAGVVGWFGSWVEAGGDAATIVNVSTDKNSYKPGEKIKVTIPSSAGGTAIFSVESGREFSHIESVPTKNGTTTYEIKATTEMCPNVYIGVTLIQPQKDRDNDRPIRMYGVTDIEVDDPELHLNPIIQTPQEIRPASNFAVTVSEKDGKPMEYTIAVVDEGLLSITSFRTPSPFPTFYTREALGIKTWDFYDYIFGAYGARLEKAFAVGGDESLSPEQDEKNNRFKPVVLFEGPFSLKRGEKKTHNLTMPDYIGEVRVMVVAANTKGQYGSAFANTTVKQPLMISVSMPRLFTPGDIMEVPVTVFAMNDNIRDVEIKAETDNFLELVEGNSRKVTFTEKGDQIVWFKYRVKADIGISNMKFTAQSGQEKAAVEENVEIRIPNPRITWLESKMLNSGETADFNSKLAGMDMTSVLEISSIPPLNLGYRLPYLISYPYGCGEQITSGAFPQISLSTLMELTPQQEADVEKNVKSTISRLSRYQTSSGGFAYWPGDYYPNEWVSSYIGHFLAAASKRGFHVPQDLMEKNLTFLRNTANNYSINSYWAEMEQAYRLYVLALSGRPYLAAMNRMKELELKNNTAQWMLASAYALCNHKETALSLIRNVSSHVDPYRQRGGTFGSSVRDKAIILQSMVSLDMQEEAYRILEDISAELSKNEWMSTQTTAYALLAASDYVNHFVGKMDAVKVDVKDVNGKTENINIKSTVYQQELPIKDGKSNVQVKNNSQATLFVRQITSGVPLDVVTERIMSKLFMNVVCYVDGKRINPDSIAQGTDVIAEVSIKNTGTTGIYENLALNFLLPSGYEIINDRLTGNDDAFKQADYFDIRDDRYYVYFSLQTNETKTFTFRFNAAFPGNYLQPAIQCSAMYDDTIEAVLPGGKTIIYRTAL